MFNNIGSKIKMLAFILCVMGIIASINSAIAQFTVFTSSYRKSEQIMQTVLGFIILFGGSLGSWVGCFYLYGIGQLIENSLIIRANFARMNGDSTASLPILDKRNAQLRRLLDQGLITQEEYKQTTQVN